MASKRHQRRIKMRVGGNATMQPQAPVELAQFDADPFCENCRDRLAVRLDSIYADKLTKLCEACFYCLWNCHGCPCCCCMVCHDDIQHWGYSIEDEYEYILLYAQYGINIKPLSRWEAVI